MSAGVTLYCDCQGPHAECGSSISTDAQYRDDARRRATDLKWTVDERGDFAPGHQPNAKQLGEEFDQEWLDNAYATLAARNDSEGVSA